jgi:hypothetical protein
MYNVLKDDYGYSDDRIFTLYSDGTIPGYPGVSIDYSATYANVETVFSTVTKQMNSAPVSQQNLFVFVNDHGGYNSLLKKSYFVLWDDSDPNTEDKLWDDQLVDMLRLMWCVRNMTFVFQPCHSGGFIDDISQIYRNDDWSLLESNSVATACDWDESSYGRKYNGTWYDEFLFQWIGAVNGELPNGDSLAWDPDIDNNGRISTREAYNYAFD